MSISEVFIRRRVGTCLLALGMMLLGAVAYFMLPVASLPQVDFPTIQVEATLPGASANTMATSVATPLENQLSNVSGVNQMTSTSSSGRTNITIEFDLSRDINVSQMNGVGLVDFHGPQRPSVRIQIDPDKLAARGLTLEDVRSIVGSQTVNTPKGSISGDGRTTVLD
eukprot:gene28607-34787_t